METTTQSLKLMLLGDSAVGKTALLLRYTKNKFHPRFITTIGIDFHEKVVQLETAGKLKGRKKSEEVQLKIFDTAGQEKFANLTRQYIRGAQGICIVYDITDARSFSNITHWIDNVIGNAKVPKVLIGNKCDMGESRRAVPTEEAAMLAKKYDIPFFETSAKEDIGVDAAFQKLAEISFIDSKKKIRNGSRKHVRLEGSSETEVKKSCCSK
eukprot:TRINITY_DN780164_c0_g1_i1.p1 TRINITY_DN780164_c0_g1~~TRINITY_DN780164_c0_g1_i1.p1  ORF type:complete len:211 (-),score=41.54 TRINITY_DN780164_c0_g1_i1:202-834(-)